MDYIDESPFSILIFCKCQFQTKMKILRNELFFIKIFSFKF